MVSTELVGRALSTLPDDDQHPYRTGPWRPQVNEYRTDELSVIGSIPEDLDGIYIRNTENPVHPALQRYHPFDGDGMLHLVGFRDGTAWYRNRFVRTAGFLTEQMARGPQWAGIAEPPQATIAERGWGARTRMKDASSTDVVVHAGQIVTSFFQCGDLYRLDPETLHTVGTTDWNGWFPASGVSAHTKVDPATGEMLFFNYSTTAPYLHYGVVDADNTLVHYTPVPLPGPRLPHDMAFTTNYAVLNDCPLHWDEDLLAKGIYAARLHDAPTRFAILPRRGTEPQWFETDPTYVLHWTNAWEEGDEVVVEGFFQHQPEPKVDRDDPMRMFRYLALDYMQPRLHRWRFNLATGRASEESLRDQITEFGVINPNYGGVRSRYVYAATGVPGWFLFDGLVKHDTDRGVDDHYRFDEGVFGSEVAFVARRSATTEDDGYLITLTTDMNADRSECLIFDATSLDAGPLARLQLPERISSGTHATWADRSDLAV